MFLDLLIRLISIRLESKETSKVGFRIKHLHESNNCLIAVLVEKLDLRGWSMRVLIVSFIFLLCVQEIGNEPEVIYFDGHGLVIDHCPSAFWFFTIKWEFGDIWLIQGDFWVCKRIERERIWVFIELDLIRFRMSAYFMRIIDIYCFCGLRYSEYPFANNLLFKTMDRKVGKGLVDKQSWN